MIKVDHLIGIPFEHGKNDCFTVLRRFYADNYDIQIPDYARPDRWWDKGFDLYAQHAKENGFYFVDAHPRDFQIGDVFAMMIEAKVINHVAIYVGEGKILHHFVHRLSNVELYKGVWKRQTMGLWRHENVTDLREKETVDLMTLLPEETRRKLEVATNAA